MKPFSVFTANGFQVLLSSFALTALISHTSAQVYSLNVVGYADVDFVAGSNLVANPFNAVDNRISSLFKGMPDGTVFLPWSGADDVSFGPSNRYSTATGWTLPSATLIAPNGGFLCLPSATRITFVGDVGWPALTIRYGGVRWTVSNRFPQRFPPVFCSSFAEPCPEANLIEGTQFHKWNRSQQRYNV